MGQDITGTTVATFQEGQDFSPCVSEPFPASAAKNIGAYRNPDGKDESTLLRRDSPGFCSLVSGFLRLLSCSSLM